MPRREQQFLGIEQIAIERGATQRGSGAHSGQVLRGEAGMAAASADPREPHGPTQQRGEDEPGAKDLSATLAIRAVDHLTFARRATAGQAHVTFLSWLSAKLPGTRRIRNGDSRPSSAPIRGRPG